MADIKITESFRTELSDLEKHASELKSKILSTSGVSTLPTCKAFAQMITDLSDVILAYKQLIEKDTAELTEFADKMQELDEA